MTDDTSTFETPQEESSTVSPQEVETASLSAEPESFDREYVEKLRKEAASYRTRAKKYEEQLAEQQRAAERAKMDEVEAARAEADDLRAQLASAQEAAQRANWKASLSGKVANPDAAIKLLEDKHLSEDGQVNVDALLADYNFLAPQTTGRTPVTPANSTASKDGPLPPSAFKGKDQQWVRDNIHRLQKD